MRAESQAVSTALAPAAARLEAPDGLRQAIRQAARYLLNLQADAGYWVGELEADTTLESDYVLLQLWLDPPGPDGRWVPKQAEKIQEAARYIRSRQSPSGGWNIYVDGPDEISASVKAYFALKLAGDDAGAPHMAAARRRILDLGGVERSNSYARLYLSFFGLYDREKTPTIPPELILLSPSAYINIYEMSSWTRGIVLPLSILSARRPRRPVPAGFSIAEIFSGVPEPEHRGWSWANAFRTLDRLLKLWERSGFLPARERAIREVEKWILERLETSDGLGAIYPAMMNAIMALHELGYDADHSVLRKAISEFEDLTIRERGTMRVQPCFSPLWDTAIAAFALGVAGETGPALDRAGEWLLSKEIRRRGDWAVKNPHAEPGGWFFEFNNEFYPDIDDTAMVLLALQYCRCESRAAERRAVEWILSMQSKDCGFAAFDKDNDRWILTQVPFADHNAILDPTCPDITGRVTEALCRTDLAGLDHPAVRRAVSYLRRTQEPDGSWMGRWGVNYIYGTCFALRGLRAAGVDAREASILQAGEWIRSFQNPDGGWGESCRSYDDPAQKGIGPSTASQTAWALLGLFASGDYSSGSVSRGVRYLLETQNAGGEWEDGWYTGTGFPRVFYLKYHLYAKYFPLLALAEYANHRSRDSQ
ncbi:MAG: squalene--hopene cyclase [Acidobacteria bacterium]|nr:squalene--hopene cyclase [Acidobacteriota bacterium]